MCECMVWYVTAVACVCVVCGMWLCCMQCVHVSALPLIHTPTHPLHTHTHYIHAYHTHHTHTHTHTHTREHTHMHTRAHIRAHTHTRAHTDVRTHRHARTHVSEHRWQDKHYFTLSLQCPHSCLHEVHSCTRIAILSVLIYGIDSTLRSCSSLLVREGEGEEIRTTYSKF